MKKIAVEEHFATEEYLELVRAILTKKYPHPEVIATEKHLDLEIGWMMAGLSTSAPVADIATIVSRLLDCGEGRVKLMDEEGIDVQVLSLISPGIQIFDAVTGVAIAKRINDRLAEVVREHPGRFVGLASIPAQSPTDAAQELERAVNELGLRGATINSHVQGEYLDDTKYWVIFEAAEKLGVPIYLHPRSPSAAWCEPFAKYPPLATAMLGFGAETSLHALRLMCGGVFDQFPGLKIILGHLGEALPFWMWRVDNRWLKSPLRGQWKRLPSQYFRENFYATTSGNFSFPALLCAQLNTGVDNVLFAVDYPLESSLEAAAFMETLPISRDDKEKISHLNAERLFGLAAD